MGITTLTVNRRMAGHRVAARKGSPYPLYAAIRKYGFENMVVEELHSSRDIEELYALEVAAISEHNSESPKGYNLTSGGGGTLGHRVSEEHRAAISARMLARWDDPDFVAMLRQKSKDAALNQSPEHRAAFIAGGRAYWTPETRAERGELMSRKQKALWADPAYRAKTLAAVQAGGVTPESRARISAGVAEARAKQTPERRREIAMAAVAGRAAKRAEIENLPVEERDRIKAELSAAKSAATKAGRAAKKAARTPEEEAVVRERYRQAALRRTPEQLQKMKAARIEAMRERIT